MRNVKSFSFILILVTWAWTCRTKVRGTYLNEIYERTSNLQCKTTEESLILEMVACASICTASDKLCTGYGYKSSATKCNLCYIDCPTDGSHANFSLDHIPYSIRHSLTEGKHYSDTLYTASMLWRNE